MNDTNLPSFGPTLQLFVAVNDAIHNQGVCLGYDDDFRSEFFQEHDCYEEENMNIPKLKKYLCELGEATPFAIGCRGRPNYSGYELHLKPLNGSGFDTVCPLNKIDVPKLLSYCEVSPFGDLASMTTKIDPAVRLAMECPAERIQVIRPGYVTNILDCAEKIIEQELLRKSSYQSVDVQLNKLNIYSENGHFKPHTDTPTHDPAIFIGTVVVCLPSEHTGGDLIVRHAGKEQVFDFAKTSAENDAIYLAAFYGDCEHEVLPVTSGHRVTLTYSILKTEKYKYRGYSSTNKPDSLFDSIVRSSDHEMRLTLPQDIFTAMEKVSQSSGGFVGILLSHTYTNTGLLAGNLKGVDELVYNLLQQRAIPVSLVPIVSSYDAIIPQDGPPEELPTFSVKMHQMQGYADPRIEVHKNIPSNIPFLSGWKVDGYRLKDEKRGPEHMGNDIGDGSEERIYIKAAMIVGPFTTTINTAVTAATATATDD